MKKLSDEELDDILVDASLDIYYEAGHKCIRGRVEDLVYAISERIKE